MSKDSGREDALYGACGDPECRGPDPLEIA